MKFNQIRKLGVVFNFGRADGLELAFSKMNRNAVFMSDVHDIIDKRDKSDSIVEQSIFNGEDVKIAAIKTRQSTERSHP